MAHEIGDFIGRFLQRQQTGSFDVLEFQIDYCISKEIIDQSGGYVMVPYLNMYLGNLIQGKSIREALQYAEENDIFDYYYDLIENVEDSEFDLELTRLLNPGRKTIQLDYNELVAILRVALTECRQYTKRIKIKFVHVVDDFNITYL